MKALLYKDTFPRLLADMRERPGKWLSRLVFLLGPWACLWMVEILNENDIFSDLDGWAGPDEPGVVLRPIFRSGGLFWAETAGPPLWGPAWPSLSGWSTTMSYGSGAVSCFLRISPVAHRRQCGGWL